MPKASPSEMKGQYVQVETLKAKTIDAIKVDIIAFALLFLDDIA